MEHIKEVGKSTDPLHLSMGMVDRYCEPDRHTYEEYPLLTYNECVL